MGIHCSGKEADSPSVKNLVGVEGNRIDELIELNLEGWTPPKYKRVLDLSILTLSHLVLLPLFLPLWLVIPLAIWLEDRGPIFFVQDRLGRNGKKFRIFKFRTMKECHDGGMAGEGKQITRVGHILRATALDEFPQLINIWRGEMSFVGPRPLVPEEALMKVEQDPQGWKLMNLLHPGLTGLAQVYGNRDDHGAKAQWDLHYLLRMNLWVDLKLLILSIWITLRRQWEKNESKIQK